MNSKYVFFIFAIFFCSALNAQIPPINKPCDFWNTVTFKNGRDTILVYGNPNACKKLHYSEPLKSLASENILNKKVQPPKCLQNDTTGIYKIVNDGDNAEFTAISVNFKDQDGYEMRGRVGIRDQDGQSIASYLSDSKGFAQLIIWNTKLIKDLTFDDLGYDRITIPMSRLKNKNTTIHIKLKGQHTTD